MCSDQMGINCTPRQVQGLEKSIGIAGFDSRRREQYTLLVYWSGVHTFFSAVRVVLFRAIVFGYFFVLFFSEGVYTMKYFFFDQLSMCVFFVFICVFFCFVFYGH